MSEYEDLRAAIAEASASRKEMLMMALHEARERIEWALRLATFLGQHEIAEYCENALRALPKKGSPA